MQRAMHHPRHRNHCGVAEPGAPRPRTAANRRRHRRRRAGMGRDAAARPRPAAPRERRRLGKDPTRPTWGCGSRATHPEPERGLGLGEKGDPFPVGGGERMDGGCQLRLSGHGWLINLRRPPADGSITGSITRTIGQRQTRSELRSQPRRTAPGHEEATLGTAAAPLQLRASRISGHKGMRAAWLFLPFTWVLVLLCNAPGCGRAYSTTLPSEKAAARRPSRLIRGCCRTGKGSQPPPGF